MSAQMDGLAKLVTACRVIIPPQLDFVVMVYMPDDELKLSSAMYPSKKQTPLQQYRRARDAAAQFLVQPPRQEITAESN